jgi:hypothetical protein
LSGKFLRSYDARQSNGLSRPSASLSLVVARESAIHQQQPAHGERILKTAITAMAAAALLATGLAASAPAMAAAKKPAQPAMHPLPAIAVLPAMMIFGAKKNEKFKPTKPYGKNTRTSL